MPIFPLTAPAVVPFRTWRAEARRAWLSLAGVLSAAVLVTGCATTKAAALVDGPPLAVPQAPERVVVPAEEEPLAATSVDTPLASVPRVVQPPPPTRPRTTRNEGEARADAPQATATTATASPTPGPAAEGKPELRVVTASAQVAADQQAVHTLLEQADTDRKKVEQLKLSSTETTNLRERRRFSAAASKALKEGNLKVARTAAEKAAQLAAALAAR